MLDTNSAIAIIDDSIQTSAVMHDFIQISEFTHDFIQTSAFTHDFIQTSAVTHDFIQTSAFTHDFMYTHTARHQSLTSESTGMISGATTSRHLQMKQWQHAIEKKKLLGHYGSSTEGHSLLCSLHWMNPSIVGQAHVVFKWTN